MKIAPVILCGGSGTRLWPISRSRHPKQFVDLGNGRTLFRDTLARLASLPDALPPLIVCNEAHRLFVQEEMAASHARGSLILEPAPRNTAPAVALAALLLSQREAGLMLVMPADHYMASSAEFGATVRKAMPLAQAGRIVTFGVKPGYPETGYGYIRAGVPLPGGYEVAEFVEKPAAATARKMLESGGYFWNAGIFFMRPETYLRELWKYAPEIARACQEGMAKASFAESCCRPERKAFLVSPRDSVDFAVMEKTDNAAMTPLEMKWSDMGNWEAFFQQAEKDADNNVIQGDALAVDSHDCYLHSGGRLLATVGVADLMVVETADAVVVARRGEGERIKSLVENLKKSGHYHYRQHPLVFRQWGSSEILSMAGGIRIRKLIVRPGGQMPPRRQQDCSFHWLIAFGEAQIELDGKVSGMRQNQSVLIPPGSLAGVANTGSEPLVMIETRIGAPQPETTTSLFPSNQDLSRQD